MTTGAIKQSDFGTEYPKPTRLLGRLPGLDKRVSLGWPAFGPDGWYAGPLSKQTAPAARLIGRTGAEFVTAATAAWPAPLCDFLAGLAAEAVLQRGPMPPSSQGSPPSPKPTAQAATALTIRDGVIGATIVIGATDAAVSARAPTRRRITEAEFHSLAKGGSLTVGQVYVGRGGRGVVPSKWGNPFRVGAGCTRKEAIDKYKNYVKDAGLDDDIHEITGKDLLCHCRPEDSCHADYLLELCRRDRAGSMATFVDDGLPTRIAQAPRAGAAPLAAELSLGWHGAGPPRSVNHMGQLKPFSDGGGLCSPGRWQPKKRRLPSALPGLRAMLAAQFEKAARKNSGGSDDALAFMMKLAAGRFKACPFDEDGLEETRAFLRSAIGLAVSEDIVAAGQVFHLPLIAGVLRKFDDPDWLFVQGLGEGVPLGVDEELPRTPGVFEEKGKWRLSDDAGPGTDADDNYKSVAPHLDRVRALFQEEARSGWMLELPEEEARRRYGSRLAIAALGVVEERDKIRVVHDGSHKVHVNHRIRVRDQVRCPGSGELRALILERAGLARRQVLRHLGGRQQGTPADQGPGVRLGIPGMPSRSGEGVPQHRRHLRVVLGGVLVGTLRSGGLSTVGSLRGRGRFGLGALALRRRFLHASLRQGRNHPCRNARLHVDGAGDPLQMGQVPGRKRSRMDRLLGRPVAWPPRHLRAKGSLACRVDAGASQRRPDGPG